MVTKNPVSPMQGIELLICLEASQLWQLLHLYHSYRQVLGFFPAGSSITKWNVHINLETNLELSKQLKLLVISLLFIAFSVCIFSCFFLQVTSISFSRGSHRACSGCSPRTTPGSAPAAPLGSQRPPEAPPAPARQRLPGSVICY